MHDRPPPTPAPSGAPASPPPAAKPRSRWNVWDDTRKPSRPAAAATWCADIAIKGWRACSRCRESIAEWIRRA